jgi:outer membrane protein assembly factor BamB
MDRSTVAARKPSSQAGRKRPRAIRTIASALLSIFVAAACGGRNLDSPGDASAGDLDASAADAPACAPPSVACAGQCVDLRFDPENCGACFATCSAGEVCSGGHCALVCASGTMRCGSRCVDAAHDPGNCGACGHACASSEVCAQGTCATTCLGGSAQCGQLCVDLRDDPSNCGACGVVCGGANVCVGGVCVAMNNPDSGVDAGPDASVDAGPSCAPGKQWCNGVCIDMSHDPQNCGACMLTCRSDQVCAAGKCGCTPSQIECSNKCTDPSSDAKNCGGCGAACRDREVCTQSTCVCAPGMTLCNSFCSDTTIDMANCGGCGNACAPGNVCTDGHCDPATGAWHMFGNDAQHTGTNPDEIGKPPAVTTWIAPVTLVNPQVSNTNAVWPAVVEGGRAFVTYAVATAEGFFLYALNVADGSVLWRFPFPSTYQVGHPSVSGGTVYVQTTASSEDSHLWAIDAATGTLRWSVPFNSQWEMYWAPTVVGSTVYIDGGTDGGLYGFSAADGTQLFFNGSVGPYDQWSPAFFNGNVFTFVGGNFRAHDPSTGATLWTVSVSWNWNGWSMQSSPVFGSTFAYVVSPPSLVAIDPVAQRVVWSVNGSFRWTPAVAGNEVFAIGGGNLIVRNALTGAQTWLFGGDHNLAYPPIVANGYVYVASDSNVYAVDIASRSLAWTAPVGGWLTIASRRLLVAAKDGALHGFVLSR